MHTNHKTITLVPGGASPSLKIRGSFEAMEALNIKRQLIRNLSAHGDAIHFDLQEMSSVDLTGFNCMVSLVRAFRRSGRRVTVQYPATGPFARYAGLCCMQEYLGDHGND